MSSPAKRLAAAEPTARSKAALRGLPRGSAPSRALGGRLLDIRAVAEHLATSERHVRRLVDEHRIPYVKVGHFVRFDPAELAKWIDDCRVPVFDRRSVSQPRWYHAAD